LEAHSPYTAPKLNNSIENGRKNSRFFAGLTDFSYNTPRKTGKNAQADKSLERYHKKLKTGVCQI